MSERLGDAILELKTDSKKFDKGIGKAEKRTQKLGTKLKSAGQQAALLKTKLLAIGAAIVVGAGILKAIKSVTDLGDKMAKMSQRTGIAIETLSSLQLVAELGGASIDSFAKGMKTLSKNMFDMTHGAGEEAKKSFKDIGIEVENADGSLRDVLDVVFDIADEFKGMAAGARKAAVAQTVLGRAGIDLIPTLNQGSEAIRRQIQLAKDLGLTWTEVTGPQAEKFNDEITKLTFAMSALWKNIVMDGVPALTKLSTGLVKGIVATRNMNLGIGNYRLNLLALLAPASTWANIITKIQEETDKATTAANKHNTALETTKERMIALAAASQKVAQEQAKTFTDRFNKDMEEGRVLTESMKTEQEALNDALTRFLELRNMGAITEETFGRANKEAIEDFEKSLADLDEEIKSKPADLEKMGDAFEKQARQIEVFEGLFDSVTRGISTNIDGVIQGTQELTEAFRKMTSDILLSMSRFFAELAIEEVKQRLKNILFPTGAGAPGSPSFVGPRQPKKGIFGLGGFLGIFDKGGIVPGRIGAPMPAIVHGGEEITPPGKSSGGGAAIIQNINISPGIQGTVRAEIMAMMPLIKRVAIDAVLTSRSRGGGMARAMGSRA